jgi:ubiquinone/menaquinone biosynthesis C-methylase UbiE
VLSDRLFLAALSAEPNCDIGIETLLTAIRRVLLLEVPAERFEDKALTGFVLALIRQCMSNDHVFEVSRPERTQLDALAADWGALQSGDMEQARRLMLNLLYRSPDSLLPPGITIEECRAIRPRALGELLAEWLDEQGRLTSIAGDLPVVGALEDATSRKAAGRYDTRAYPRWRSLQMPRAASAAQVLRPFFSPEKMAFMDEPFKVLIAGAGTGQQAIAAAIRYGPKAEVVAMDLSRPNLAYAKARAEHFGVGNLRFVQGDLLQIAESGEGPFDVIEAVGVLHDMADPFKGWQILTKVLRAGGIMLAGLHSAAARRRITAMRSEADYPGADCDDNAARQYRSALVERRDECAAQLTALPDFYTMGEFRDLVLNAYERPIFLSEVEAFLEQNHLTFKGFQLPMPIIAHFHQLNPDDKWPGSLANWGRYEEANPQAFTAMYQLWCEKAV